MGGAQPSPLGGVVVGLPAEALVHATVDLIQVDAEAGQQLAVAGLGAGERAGGDHPLDLGADGLQVQAMAAQQAGRGAVAVGKGIVALVQQPEQQVLGAEVLVPQALGLQAAEVGTMPACLVVRTMASRHRTRCHLSLSARTSSTVRLAGATNPGLVWA
jgi:hypothetical protein